MRITDVKLHVFERKFQGWLTAYSEGILEKAPQAGTMDYSLVRVITDQGVEGNYIVWGEIPQARSGALTEELLGYKPYLVGEDPLDIERIWQKLGSFWYGGGGGPGFAAIDICLWDIAGKLTGLPIYRLLGAYRNKIAAYASGLPPSKDKCSLGEFALKLKKRGFKAFKIHPISVAEAGMLREILGDDVALIFDAVFAYDRRRAFEVGKKLEELGFWWYEAPLPTYDIEGYEELCSKLNIPITVELYRNYKEFIKRKAVDLLRPFIDFAGGITGLKKLANYCEALNLNIEPHSYGCSMKQAANLHVMLSIKNCAFFEFPIDKEGNSGIHDIGSQGGIEIDEKGFVHAPGKPGLGLEIDWKQVEKATELL